MTSDEPAAAKTQEDQSTDNHADSKTTDAEKMPPNEASNVPAAAEAMNEEDESKKPLTQPEAAAVYSNDAARVEFGGVSGPPPADDPYPALTKQELMKYATDPFWVRLRWFLFVLFWLVWLAMLVVSVLIIVQAPKCYTPAPKQWWQKAPVHQVQVKSFKDSNGDGLGDLEGISSKLDYLSALGVGSLWLSPIYPSPNKEQTGGYDISNYVDIDPDYGSMEDFKNLLSAAHEHGLKVILDFVPNHSSDQHEWFKKSAKKEAPYADFYIWKAGTRGTPPNDWKSASGSSAWEWNSERGEYYYHQFDKSQPDLNLRNENVVKELKKVLQFWLDLGVDGFGVDAAGHLFEDDVTRFNHPENLQLLKDFREVMDAHTLEAKEDEPRILLTEANLSLDDLADYYGTNFTEHSGDISHLPINFALITAFEDASTIKATELKEHFSVYLNGLPVGAWPNFNLGHRDSARLASRVGPELLDAMNMLTMLLPGTPITYYGDEIGMEGGKDKAAKSPMQWDDSDNAGFTSGTPWTPVNANYKEVNVAKQLSSPSSHLQVFQALSEMRHHQAILFGSTNFMTGGNDDVLMFSRFKKGNPGYLVAVNLGDEKMLVSAKGLPFVPKKGTVHIKSGGLAEGDSKQIDFENITLQPKEGLVMTFVPKMD